MIRFYLVSIPDNIRPEEVVTWADIAEALIKVTGKIKER
jgi:hypothetical protein